MTRQKNTEPLSIVGCDTPSRQSVHDLSSIVGRPARSGLADLDRIQLGENETRQLNQEHVEDLAKSISSVGLIHPIVIDQNSTLLAGGHRLAALRLLKEKDSVTFHRLFPRSRVPVQVLDTRGRGKEIDFPFIVAIAENEKRRDYSPAEVLILAQKLREMGYMDCRGRPPAGERPLLPALSLLLGKSLRTVRRLMRQAEAEKSSSNRGGPSTRTQRTAQMKRCLRAIESCQTTVATYGADPDRLEACLAELKELVLAAINAAASQEQAKLAQNSDT